MKSKRVVFFVFLKRNCLILTVGTTPMQFQAKKKVLDAVA
jgi:hypothetical protein